MYFPDHEKTKDNTSPNYMHKTIRAYNKHKTRTKYTLMVLVLWMEKNTHISMSKKRLEGHMLNY